MRNRKGHAQSKTSSHWKRAKRERDEAARLAAIENSRALARSHFNDLVCSKADSNSQLGMSLGHLRSTLDGLLQNLPAPYGNASQISPLFGPFLARSILEVSLTALVARIDPFRILTIGKAQSHAGYDASISAALAFRWQSDVMAEERPPGDLWSAKVKVVDASRALLGQYQDALFWQPSFERFLDFVASDTSAGDWTAELKNTAIERFIPKFRTVAASVYSRSSKGVHHEYVLPPATYFDPASIQDLLDDTLKTVLCLAVVANFSTQILAVLSERTAFEVFEGLQL